MAASSGNYPRLGKNIRGLRKATGETQLNLALAIGASGPNVISQYESGERMPERDYLLKIAKHFRITENELLHGNFENFKNITKAPIDNPSFNIAMMEKMFPLICTDEALQNQNFKKAYQIHAELLSQLHQGLEVETEKIEPCMELYKAAREEGLVEAAANHLWWLMFIGFLTVLLTPRLLESFDMVDTENLTIKDFLGGILPSYDEDSTEEDFDTSADRHEFLEENEVDIIVDIFHLRKSKIYAELGDFYLALRHKFSLLSNTLSPEMNSAVGDEMLLTFKLLGNKYCDAFLRPPASQK